MDDSFKHIWALLSNHGGVAEAYKKETVRIWNEYNIDEQREIYRSIRAKLQNGKFVNYVPYKAIQENAPKKKKNILSFVEYYTRFGTTEEQGGWKMTNPTGKQVIYIKN